MNTINILNEGFKKKYVKEDLASYIQHIHDTDDNLFNLHDEDYDWLYNECSEYSDDWGSEDSKDTIADCIRRMPKQKQYEIIDRLTEPFNESFKKTLAAKPIKESATPYGGDKKSFYMFYVGPTSGRVSRKDVIDFAKKHGCDSIYWASDDATGYKASYNGDTLVVFNRKDINDMPDDYKEDAKKYGKVITESFSRRK